MTTARVVSSMWRVEREPDDIVHGTDKFHDYLLPRLAPLVDEVVAFDLLRPHLSQVNERNTPPEETEVEKIACKGEFRLLPQVEPEETL